MNLGQEPLCFQVSAFNARIGPIMLISYLPRDECQKGIKSWRIASG